MHIIEEIKIELSASIEEKEAIFSISSLDTIPILPFQFTQLFLNLINNSLKFRSLDRVLEISISSIIRTGHTISYPSLLPHKLYCHIRFSDNGIGFENQYKDRIFEVFERLHTQTEYQGTGIGLAIVKKVVDNHQGFIEASSEINVGTTFDIYIPLKIS